MTSEEIIWCHCIIKDLGFLQNKLTILYSNFQSTIQLPLNPKFHSIIKHVDIKYYMLKERVKNQVLQIDYFSSNANLADIFTKALIPEKFKQLQAILTLDCT